MGQFVLLDTFKRLYMVSQHNFSACILYNFSSWAASFQLGNRTHTHIAYHWYCCTKAPRHTFCSDIVYHNVMALLIVTCIPKNKDLFIYMANACFRGKTITFKYTMFFYITTLHTSLLHIYLYKMNDYLLPPLLRTSWCQMTLHREAMHAFTQIGTHRSVKYIYIV